MHVALNAWFWDHPHTGSGQYLRHLLHEMSQLAPDITFSLIMPPHNPAPDDVPDTVDIITTGKRQKSNRWQKVWFEQRTFPQTVTRCGADLAHIPYWGPPLGSSVPMVASVLDMTPLLYPMYSQSLASRFYNALVSAAARGANHILTLSETSKLDIEQQLGIASENITVTYLAQGEHFHPKIGAERDAVVRKKYDLPDRFVLGGFGFLPHKQINELLLAYTYVGEAEGDNIPLVLVGKEPDWSNPLYFNLRKYAERLNITEYVRWIGFIDEADKPSIYRLADVFAFPSEYEGFGLPPLEAMACGTPVVAWDSVVADEIFEDGAYLVDNARSMAGAIIALLLQKPFSDTMINQGLAQATKYRWRTTAEETLIAYEQVLLDQE